MVAADGGNCAVLELEKAGLICSHIISGLQWHPSTIGSAPDQKTLTLHISNQSDGSWTDRLQQFSRRWTRASRTASCTTARATCWCRRASVPTAT